MLGEIVPVILQNFSALSRVVSLFFFLSLEMRVILVWKKINSHHQRMFYAKFGWNFHSGSEEEDL